MKSHPTRFYFVTLLAAVLLSFSPRPRANETEKQNSPQLPVAIEGFVLAPDGSPLPGVTIALITSSNWVAIHNGQLEDQQDVQAVTAQMARSVSRRRPGRSCWWRFTISAVPT